MGKLTLYGILLSVGVFLSALAFVLAQINVENPLTGQETSVFGMILEWIIP